jgi:hypothetical protein
MHEFSLTDPDFQRFPYPLYTVMRQNEAPFWHGPSQMWIAARYEDVSALLRDRRLGRTTAQIQDEPALPAELEPFRRLSQHSLFDKEPPDHTRLRSLVSGAFTPRRVEALRPKIEAAAAALLNLALQRQEFDLLEDYAVPLPVTVIADLLGIPAGDRHRLRPWSADIVAMYELTHTTEQEQKAVLAAEEFWEYLRWLADERRRYPQDDLLSALAFASDPLSGARLSEAELIATCILLLNAGHEATVNGFGNGMYALLQHPALFEQLRTQATPKRIQLAVEEMLRYDTPLQLFKRWVLEELVYKDQTMKQGEQVALFFGSANRDPARFDQPEALLLERQDNPHLTFGAGIHFCLGAPLARLELNIALSQVLHRTAHFELAEQPTWRSSLVIRGLKSLRIRCGK